MNALARHHVGQGDARGQHSHPHFAIPRLGALFFHHPKRIGSAVVSDDDTRVPHGLLLPRQELELVRRNGWLNGFDARDELIERPFSLGTQVS